MKFQQLYKIIFLFLGLNLPLISLSQNLIPNGGFEEFDNHEVKLWKQPADPYYHFEKIEGASHSGIAYNGLCLWKWQISEFMSIELAEPLEKGTFYEFNMFTRRDPNTTEYAGDSLTQIGILFTNIPKNVSKKIVALDSANILLRLEPINNWYSTKGLYLAKGGEKYFTLGYFASINGKNNNCVQHQDLEARFIKMDSLKKAENDSIDKALDFLRKEYALDKSWDEINKIQNKRLRKKQEIQFKQNNNIINKNIQLAIEQIQRYYSNFEPPYEIINSKNSCSCHVRYYFDDLELTKISDDKLVAEHLALENIYFDTDKSILKSTSFQSLDYVVNMLNERKNILIRIDGYTDNVGDKNHNIQLSDDRAQSVANYLILKGINKNIISSKGFGADHPISSNSTEIGRAKNRRVVISIVKIP